VTLVFDWFQLMAIWGDCSILTALRLQEQDGYVDKSWIGDLEGSLFRWIQIFNLDIEAIRSNFDFAFLSTIGWREIHLFSTVVVPLLFSSITVCLLRSLSDIMQLLLLTCSALLLIFGAAAHVILARGTELRDTEETAILGIDQASLNWTIGIGAALLLSAIAFGVYMRVSTYRLVRRYLEREVDKLSHELHELKEGVLGDAFSPEGRRKSALVQEDLPNAKELERILQNDHQVHFVGGRAGDVTEFARQMVEHDKQKKLAHGHGHIPDLLTFTRTLIIWLIISALALLMWMRVTEVLPQAMLDSMSSTYSSNYFIAAILFSTASIALLIYQMLSLFEEGQKIADEVVAALKAGYVGFLMLLVLILYIPISKQAISVFICDEHNCKLGEWFPVQSPGTDATLSTYINSFTDSYVSAVAALTADGNSTGDSTVQALAPPTTCQRCNFLSGPVNGQCPAYLADELCAPSTSLRLAASPSIDCLQQWAFYIPGALLTLLTFTLGVPWMFYQLTTRHTRMYDSLEIYVEDRKKKGSPSRPGQHHHEPKWILYDCFRGSHHGYTQWQMDDMWLRRVRQAKRNRAKSLYADFEYDWRYWKLVMLAVKFLVIMVDAVAAQFESPLVAPMLMIMIHSCMMLLSVFARPYTDKRPDLFSMSITLANIINWSCLFIFAAKIAAPSWVLWLLLGANFAMPLLSLLVGHCYNKRVAYFKRKEHERQLEDNSKRMTYVKDEVVAAKRRGVERECNNYTLRFISKWTWLVLVTCVIGGELIFIGTFAEAALSPVTGHTSSRGPVEDVVDCHREEYARSQEFIGYGNWQNFTDHCCCMSRANVTDRSPATLNTHVVELWACVKDDTETPVVYKERQRRDLEPGALVAPVRGFCETHFRNPNDAWYPTADSGEQPVWDESRRKLGVWTYKRNGTSTALVRDMFYDDYW